VVKPVELIAKARRRLALVAAADQAARWAVPALTGLILGAALGPIGAVTWERAGYILSDTATFTIRLTLLAIGVIALIIGSIGAWQAAGRTGFVDAAARVDEAVGGHEEVLTLASLSEAGQTDAETRSALFPMLWRRVTNLLEAFDPDTVFRLDLGEPLRRSSLVALPVVIGLALATLALMRPPTPMQIQARKLIDLANSLANEPGGEDLAKQVESVAKDIENPDVPQQEKMQKLADLMNRIDKQQQQQAQTPPDQKKPANGADKKQQMASASNTGSSNSGSGASNGKSNGQSNGQSNGSTGNASSGKGESSGNGQSAGKGNGSANGNGAGNGNGTGNAGKEASAGGDSSNNNASTGGNNASSSNAKSAQNQQMMELQKQLAKAQAQVAMEGSKTSGPKTASGGNGNGAGNGPKPGSNPNNPQLANNQNNPHNNKGPGQGNKPGGSNGNGPKPGSGPNPAGGNQVAGGNQGDTHLGEMPAPVRFERFYQPGQTGPVLNIRDTRFVLFRLPTATPGAAGGRLSTDKAGVHASTPYVNVPLSQAHLEVAPDEHQLVPPRYRELIH